jgi:hypothetical protein
MKNTAEKENIDKFIERLNFYKKENVIKTLCRGFSKEFVFPVYNLELKYHSINDFAKCLFYYGDKSKYFWEQKNGRDFGLNDTSNEVFEYVFDLFSEIVKSPKKEKTIKYIRNNSKQFDFFIKSDNKSTFIKEIKSINENKKTELRNFYFRIIHQLGETQLKDKSILISATEEERQTEKFSGKNGIKIYFWDFDFNNIPLLKNSKIPIFHGKPYRNQKEISIFGVIFPHYIYAVKDYDSGKIIFNPALKNNKNYDEIILAGFDIDQTKFSLNLKNQTNIEFGLQYNNSEFKLIK